MSARGPSQLLSASPPSPSVGAGGSTALGAHALQTSLEAALTAWPGLLPRAAELERHVRQRLERAEVPLSGERLDDVVLACACSLGEAKALLALETRFQPLLRMLSLRAESMGVSADELRQALRVKLCVGTERTGPLLLQYSGRGPLHAWLKVTGVRLLLDLAGSNRARDRLEGRERNEDSAHDGLEGLPWLGEDPALSHLKSSARAPFRAALREALAEVGPEARSILKQHYLHGMGIDALAELLAVHRSTAARAIIRARRQLLARLRRALTNRLGLLGSELDSFLRLVQRDSALSLTSLLSLHESDPGRAGATTHEPEP